MNRGNHVSKDSPFEIVDDDGAPAGLAKTALASAGSVDFKLSRQTLNRSLRIVIDSRMPESLGLGGTMESQHYHLLDEGGGGGNDAISNRNEGSGLSDSRDLGCLSNCSGNGECIDGFCHCMIRFDGADCKHVNFSYHVAFSSIFFLLALTSLIQLAVCIHAEYLRMKKNPSLLKACRITTQKTLYFLVFLAASVRGAYFAAPTISSEWSTSLLSAYYPVVLTSASLIVCFWAEVFHLREIRWDRPRFLSKSFLGFAAFNVISYSLLVAEMTLVWWVPDVGDEVDDKGPSSAEEVVDSETWSDDVTSTPPAPPFVVKNRSTLWQIFMDPDHHRMLDSPAARREFYAHLFNGCYAVLMFVVVIFFLIYGVEVFFKVRGGFTVSEVPHVIGGTRVPLETRPRRRRRSSKGGGRNPEGSSDLATDENELACDTLLAGSTSAVVRCEVAAAGGLQQRLINHRANADTKDNPEDGDDDDDDDDDELNEDDIVVEAREMSELNSVRSKQRGASSLSAGAKRQEPESNQAAAADPLEPRVNVSQLHQSRLGLLSQALMMITIVGFLFAETLEELWKTKANLLSRNTHDILFRTIEIGVALWFPCVLWNCIRPEQLWCLNPKKIIDNRFKSRYIIGGEEKATPEVQSTQDTSPEESTTDEDGPECWICYDTERSDAGPMIHPCDCRGDVGAVHHDCLRRWLVESADNPDALKCKVCSAPYMVEKGSQFSLANGFTAKQWLQTASLVTVMCLTMGGSWAVIQLYPQPWIRTLAVGSGMFVQYLCMRSLGLNTVSAYQRAKVSALKIVNLGIGRGHHNNNNNNRIGLVVRRPSSSVTFFRNQQSALASATATELVQGAAEVEGPIIKSVRVDGPPSGPSAMAISTIHVELVNHHKDQFSMTSANHSHLAQTRI